MNSITNHVTRCVLAGMVALLPIGGTVVLLVWLESELRTLLIGLPFYIPGMALALVLAAFYLLGLFVSSVLGGWLLRVLDRLVSRMPLLGSLYDTLKQMAGYGGGEHSVFQRAVLLLDDATGASELALVTGEIAGGDWGAEKRLIVFVPTSPNPANGRLLVVDPSRTRPLALAVDEAWKALFSVGKTLPARAGDVA